MKLLLLPITLLTSLATAQAQQLQVGMKVAAGCSLPTGKYVPAYTRPVSGSGSGSALYQTDSYDYTLKAKPGFTTGLVARYPAAGRWSYGVEVLLQYQPFAIEQRFSPEKAGYNQYVSVGGGLIQNPNGSIVVTGVGFVRDQNGNILLDANGRPRLANALYKEDLPTTYRYSMASLELPLYARYAAAERWHLQAGVAPILLLDRQVHIETSYPEAQASGQPKVATTRQKQEDPALRLVNWRLVAEAEYQLNSRVACTLSLRPSLSSVFSTNNQQKRATPYQVQQHAVSIAAVYFLP